MVRRLVTALVMFAVATAVLGGVPPLGSTDREPAALAADLSDALGGDPFVSLFSEVGDCGQVRGVNGLSGGGLDARLSELVGWYEHFHAEGSNVFTLGDLCRGSSSSTLAAKLAGRGVWVSNYRNGSYVSQSSLSAPLLFGEAADLEAEASLAIATFWPGNYEPYVAGEYPDDVAVLSGSLSAGAATVRVKSAALVRPGGTTATWPYRNSRGSGTGAGAYSANTHDFVSWIRVGNEIMQVTANPYVAGGDVVLSVRRGIWGTSAVSHGANQRVFSPVYIGSKSAVAVDQGLSGSPGRNDTRYPLRYGIKLWQPDGYGWIADRIRDSFGPGLQGYNTFWLDVTSCVQYNNADWLGNPVWGWDDTRSQKLSRNRWGDHQQTKLAGLRQEFPGKHLIANTLQNNDSCADELLGGHVDAGVMENWMRTDGSWGNGFSWTAEMDRVIRTMANNSPAAYWVRWNRGVPNPQQYQRFAYGSLLLGYRPNATQFTYGGPFNLDKPGELYFWDWGTPTQTSNQISGLKLASGLYTRTYSNGLILVNPTNSPITHNLTTTHYDVINKTNQEPTPTTTITIKPKDAAFLLTNPTTTPTNVVRQSGADRFATAAAVSKAAFGSASTVYVAFGFDFPDALGAAAAAGADNAPVLLVAKDSVPAATGKELARLGPSQIVVVGGAGVISNKVINDLGAYIK